jgi:hypothetical protein
MDAELSTLKFAVTHGFELIDRGRVARPARE